MPSDLHDTVNSLCDQGYEVLKEVVTSCMTKFPSSAQLFEYLLDEISAPPRTDNVVEYLRYVYCTATRVSRLDESAVSLRSICKDLNRHLESLAVPVPPLVDLYKDESPQNESLDKFFKALLQDPAILNAALGRPDSDLTDYYDRAVWHTDADIVFPNGSTGCGSLTPSAEVSVIDYAYLKAHVPDAVVTPTSTRLTTTVGSEIPVLGMTILPKLEIEDVFSLRSATFYVINLPMRPVIIGYNLIKPMGFEWDFGRRLFVFRKKDGTKALRFARPHTLRSKKPVILLTASILILR